MTTRTKRALAGLGSASPVLIGISGLLAGWW